MEPAEGKPVRLTRDISPEEERLYPSFLARPHTLPHLLEMRARSDGDRLAFVAPDGRLTFSEWADRSSRAAHALTKLGVQQGDRVGIWGGNEHGCDWVVSFLAVQWVGAIPILLNSRMPVAKAAEVVSSIGGGHMILASAAAADVPTELQAVAFEDLRDASGSAAPILADERLAAGILLTSGTTGPSKCALLSHRCFAYIAAQTEDHILGAPAGIPALGPDDVIQTSIPLHTGTGYMHYLALGLHTGCRLVCEERFDVDGSVATMVREKSTFWLCVPAMMVLLADRYSSAIEGSSVRVVWHMGTIATPPSIQAMRVLFPGAAVLNLYSLTESGSGIVGCTNKDAIEYPSTVGRPSPHARIRIVTAEGRDANPGERGEIWFESPEMFEGYWANPQASLAPWTTDGWLRSGDGGYLNEDGLLWVTGRLGDVIIRGGFNISPSMVERTLQSFPGVLDAAVTPVPHRVLGQDIVGVVVARDAVDVGALQAHCRAELADYEVPRTIMPVDSLPRNDMGKLDRHRIRAMAEEYYARVRGEEAAKSGPS